MPSLVAHFRNGVSITVADQFSAKGWELRYEGIKGSLASSDYAMESMVEGSGCSVSSSPDWLDLDSSASSPRSGEV